MSSVHELNQKIETQPNEEPLEGGIEGISLSEGGDDASLFVKETTGVNPRGSDDGWNEGRKKEKMKKKKECSNR